jgi:hypothetical protein
MKSKKKWWFFASIALLGVIVRLGFSKEAKHKDAMHDDTSYHRFCQEVILDPALYSTFRSHPLYAIFQESLNKETAQTCLIYLENHYPHLLQEKELIETLDAIGHPPKVKRANGPEISYPTLRNLKIAGDITRHFGMFRGKRIVQIGAGDGTLCHIIKKLHSPSYYCIIDNPSALALAEKTLADWGIEGVELCTLGEYLSSGSIDLVISPFVFAESQRHMQEVYLARILRHAQHGYLECRFPMQHFGLKVWSQSQIIERLRGIGKRPRLLKEGGVTDLNHCQVLYP